MDVFMIFILPIYNHIFHERDILGMMMMMLLIFSGNPTCLCSCFLVKFFLAFVFWFGGGVVSHLIIVSVETLAVC